MPEQDRPNSPYLTFAKGRGSKTQLQLEDLLRHAGQSKKSKQRSSFHALALQHWQKLRDGSSGEGPVPLANAEVSEAPLTPCQVLLSLETLHNARSCQGQGYELRCKSAHSMAPSLVPLQRSSRNCHFKIMDCFKQLIFEDDRLALAHAKCIGLAQDHVCKNDFTRVAFGTID